MVMHKFSRQFARAALGLFGLLLLVPAAAFCADDEAAVRAQRFDAEFPRLMKAHCWKCHGGSEPKGELRLDQGWKYADIATDRARWESVLEMIETGAMPPDDQPQPKPAERQQLVTLLESALFELDCDLPRDPGRVTVRRLNRNEYDNTLRDLLGLDLKLARDFPSDDVGNGFDNIGDVLALPPLLLEKYIEAAEKAAAAAIQDPRSLRQREVREGDRLRPSGSARRTDDGYLMVSEGSVATRFQIERPGKYRLRITAGADQAGPEVAKMEVRGPEGLRHVIDVPAKRTELQPYDWTLDLPQGEQRIEVRFINDYYRPDDPDPNNRDRNLLVKSVALAGPETLEASEFSESHRRLVTARPDDPADRRQLRDAARRVLEPLVRRAFRRPVSREELSMYVGLVELATANGETYERGLQVALTGVLVSPQFLFRLEREPDSDDPTQARPLNDFELATRLSYFLWSSMPDDELFQLAEEGKLKQPEILEGQVRRMLRDPKAWALAENFAAQWLNLRNLADVSPDPATFPEFNDQLRRDMQRETLEFFMAIVREDRPITEFLTADYTYVNQRLAAFYGLPQDRVQGEEFQRVSLDPGKRQGVLTQASILTLTSNPQRTSAVKRGKWIMENLLGTPPPEPPPDVPMLEETQKTSPELSLRQQMEVHRSNPVCASCHRQMDALGFGFENYDAIGRWRDTDGKTPIDASGVLPGGESFAGPRELIAILSGEREQFGRFMAEKLLTFALGRGLEYYDQCAVREIAEEMDQAEYRFSALVLGIVQSEPFLLRRGEKDASAAETR